jgi:hypothetical protein
MVRSKSGGGWDGRGLRILGLRTVLHWACFCRHYALTWCWKYFTLVPLVHAVIRLDAGRHCLRSTSLFSPWSNLRARAFMPPSDDIWLKTGLVVARHFSGERSPLTRT